MTSPGKGRRRALVPAVAAIVLALIGVLALLAPHHQQASGAGRSTLAHPQSTGTSVPASSRGSTTTRSQAGTSSASSTSSATADEDAPSYAPGQEPWRPTITGFATDFTQPGPDWSTRITRWTSDYLTAQYSQTDDSRAPTGTLQGIEVSTTGESLVDVIATYDTGVQLIIRAEDSVAGWKITRVEPVEHAASNGRG